jgi:adenosine deaminase
MSAEIPPDSPALPKTDLHSTSTGRPVDTILDLARRQTHLPTVDRAELRKRSSPPIRRSLDDYLRAFDITLSVMQTEEGLERCAFELAEDAWRENVRYLEVRYSPLHTREGLRPAQVVEAVLAAYGTPRARSAMVDPVRDPDAGPETEPRSP